MVEASAPTLLRLRVRRPDDPRLCHDRAAWSAADRQLRRAPAPCATKPSARPRRPRPTHRAGPSTISDTRSRRDAHILIERGAQHLAAAEEAVTLYRDLAHAEPARHTPALAHSLQSLGNRLGELGEYRRALAAAEEAVTLYRDLARAEPTRYTPDLARSLHNLGVQFRRVDQVDEQLRVRAEAVAWWARLARLRPDEHQDTYRRERANLGKLFTERGLDLGAAIVAENTALLHLPPPPPDDVPGDAEPRDFPTTDENDIR